MATPRLLLRLVQPLPAVPRAPVIRHPFLLASDVLEAFGSRLLDFIDLEPHLPVNVVRDACAGVAWTSRRRRRVYKTYL